MKIIVFLLTAFILSLNPLHAELVPTSELQEEVNQAAEINTSGTIISLISNKILFGGYKELIPKFEVWVPISDVICVNYITRNGRYLAKQTFKSDTEGWAVVPFEPRKTHALKSIDPQSLAVRVFAGENCELATISSGLAPTPLPVRSFESDDNTFSIVIHSNDSPARLLFRRNSEQKPFHQSKCQTVSSLSRIYFDKYCSFETSLLKQKSISLSLVVLLPYKVDRQEVNLEALSKFNHETP